MPGNSYKNVLVKSEPSARVLELSKVERIVVIGFRPPILSFARRCRDLGITVYLIDVRNQTSILNRFPSWIQTPAAAMKWSDIGTDHGLERILSYVRSAGADAVISADEGTLCWLAEHRASFEPQCRVMTPPSDVLTRLLCKKTQVRMAMAAGFNVLSTWYLDHANSGTAIPEREFPICVRPTKPDSVHPGFKVKVFATPNELGGWLKSLQTIRQPLIAQPFRNGPNVVVHGVRDQIGAITPLEAYRTARRFRGFAQSLEMTELPTELRQCCARFAKMAGIVGPFHFDLLHSDEDECTYFLEVNQRLGGTTAKVTGMGYDEAALTLQAFDLVPPHYRGLESKTSRVTSKRSLVRQMVDTLAGRDQCEFRYPRDSRSGELLKCLFELFKVADPLLSMDDLEGSLRYLLCSDSD